MCLSSPSVPAPPPPPAPPAPPPEVKPLEPAPGTNRNGVPTNNRGRASLRIDRTVNPTGSSGSGLNIPS